MQKCNHKQMLNNNYSHDKSEIRKMQNLKFLFALSSQLGNRNLMIENAPLFKDVFTVPEKKSIRD